MARLIPPCQGPLVGLGSTAYGSCSLAVFLSGCWLVLLVLRWLLPSKLVLVEVLKVCQGLACIQSQIDTEGFACGDCWYPRLDLNILLSHLLVCRKQTLPFPFSLLGL